MSSKGKSMAGEVGMEIGSCNRIHYLPISLHHRIGALVEENYSFPEISNFP